MQGLMKLSRNQKLNKRNSGFTILELLIVIVVIGILAGIVVVSYGGVRQQAAESKKDSDLVSLKDAIVLARANNGETLNQITGRAGFNSVVACITTDNPSPQVEPSQLATSTNCWQNYYTALDAIGTASKTDLDDLKKGDARGNPYLIAEYEGVDSGSPCSKDRLGYFTGSGASWSSSDITYISFSLPECL